MALQQFTLFRLGGGCNAARCDGMDSCPCRRKLSPRPCGCPVVVDGLKGAHAEGCPYMAQAMRHGDTLEGWARRVGGAPLRILLGLSDATTRITPQEDSNG